QRPMHIHDDHRHYGSALIQIAEDRHFSAINAFRYKGRSSRCGFRVNKDIGIYIRYRTEAKGKRWPVYSFLFSEENLKELLAMHKRLDRLYLALICVDAREICCLPHADFEELIGARREATG